MHFLRGKSGERRAEGERGEAGGFQACNIPESGSPILEGEGWNHAGERGVEGDAASETWGTGKTMIEQARAAWGPERVGAARRAGLAPAVGHEGPLIMVAGGIRICWGMVAAVGGCDPRAEYIRRAASVERPGHEIWIGGWIG
jgi:hypothetical protein